MAKFDLLNKVLNHEVVERVPTAFWFHYLQNELDNAFDNPALVSKSLEGHKRFIENYDPDIIKIMTDGFFSYGNKALAKVDSVSALYDLKPLDDNHEWYDRQLELAYQVTKDYKGQIPFIYNLFTFANSFRFDSNDVGSDKKLEALYREDPKAVEYASSIVSADLGKLAKRLIKEVGVTGIYLSSRNTEGFSKDEFRNSILKDEQKIIDDAKSAGGINILHICGYEGYNNDLSFYEGVKVDIVNWAVVVENVPLEEGRKLFKDSVILGGFANTTEGILYKGSLDELKDETRRLIKNAGSTGLILGADCTIPRDTTADRLLAIKEAAVL